MQKATIAERVLSLAVPPERAHSTVGDLMEESESRSAAWFWWSVVRTTGAQLAREIVSAPRAMLGLAVLGWVITTVLRNGLYIAFAAVPRVSPGAHLAYLPILLVAGNFIPFLRVLPDAHLSWQMWFLLALGRLIPFLAAATVATRSRGREFPAVITWLLFQEGQQLLFIVYLWANDMQTSGTLAIFHPVRDLLLSVIAALWVRHRTLSTSKSPVLELHNPNA